MAVEILILSGARQGERLVLDAKEFKVGADPHCEVCFNVRRDSGMLGRSASFRLQDDGWYIRCVGEVFLNQQPVAGSTRLRSGDVVRMSEIGPKFSFAIVADTAVSPARFPSPPNTSSPRTTSLEPIDASLPLPITSFDCLPAIPLPELGPQVVDVDGKARVVPPGRFPYAVASARNVAPAPAVPAMANRRWNIRTIGGMALGALASVVAILAIAIVVLPPWPAHEQATPGIDNGPARDGPKLIVGNPPPTLDPIPDPPPIDQNAGLQTVQLTGIAAGTGASGLLQVTAASDNTAVVPNPTVDYLSPDSSGSLAYQPVTNSYGAARVTVTVRDAGLDGILGNADDGTYSETFTVEVKQPDVRAQLREVAFLIQREQQIGDSIHVWPFCTCIAISPDTLLTTAEEARSLAKWRVEKKSKIWVTQPANGFKEEVQDIRVSLAYDSSPPTEKDWMYYDFGLLTVGKELPKVAPLASPEELRELKQGMPVDCFGFMLNPEEITEYDTLEPSFVSGKVRVVSTLPDPVIQPRLLHIRAEIPKCPSDSTRPLFCQGSAIVNAAGKVIGIYCVAAMLPDNSTKTDIEAVKNLHYANVSAPALLNAWVQNRDEKMWPFPTVSPAAGETQEHP